MRLLSASSSTTSEALRLLRAGGIVAHATETCYGLACDLANPDAVARLFAIKKRPTEQPVSALFASVEDAKRYVVWTDEAEALANTHLPGPLTIILLLRRDAPVVLLPTPHSPLPTIGVRVSSHPQARGLVTLFGSPLSTTSANVHGEANPYDARTILERFHAEEHQPDLIIDSGPLPPVPPSTVIDLAKGKTLREGGISV